MKHRFIRLPAVILFFIIVASLQAAPLPIPKPPSTGARAFIVQDFYSNRIIAEKDSDKSVEPASITKLMTAYSVFKELQSGNISLSDMVVISEKAWRTPGSRMFVEVGKQVSVEDLLKGMIIQSGNDATVALAEYIAGSEDTFAALMNRHGEEIGLNGSHFMNASGLPDTEHYMTARDIAKLAALLISEFPEYYKWYSQKEFTFNGITQYNRNKLLWRDDTVDGVKTGHTESAGYCLVTSAYKDNMRLITVVLGTKSEGARADASQALLNYGFRFFETHKLYDADTQLATSRVWKGEIETVSLGLDSPLYATIPRGQYKSLEASMTIDNRITAPVAREQSLGIVHVQLGETVIAEQELIALQNISEGSFWQRIVDEALLYFE
ncbi:MAG: D-alanyl-D-alanine carboxypeptidase family protein [Pseudomonadota bacterium]|nr:D-alanyl-D-alanine carboxypeptidase family protein [Pseudomonadota bacterium]